MLALTSPVSTLHSSYPPGFGPGVQFALDLTDSAITMADNDDRLLATSHNPAALRSNPPGASPFVPQGRFVPWPTSTYDPFSGDPVRHASPDRPERLRGRYPPEIHAAPRPPISVTGGESFRPLSLGSISSAFTSDAGSYHQGPPPRSDPDENLALRRQSQDSFALRTGSPTSQGYNDYEIETQHRIGNDFNRTTRYQTRRRPFNQDEFDGPSQLLPLPLPQQEHARSQTLLSLPVNLTVEEQDEVVHRVNEILSRCAFHFIAKYQFPIPLERDKARVRAPSDREWTEWAYLLKRLATKRRIPARVLFENQIKQFVTTLENSIAARPQTKDHARTPKDDRYMLQLISAGTQVAKILMDSLSMEQLDDLYMQSESIILDRRSRNRGSGFH